MSAPPHRRERVFIVAMFGGGRASGTFARGNLTLTGAARLWPTPDAVVFNLDEDLQTWEARRAKNAARGINGNGMGTPVKLWPTPTGQDAVGSGSAGYPKSPTHNSGTTLTDAAVRGLWPTPTARDEDRMRDAPGREGGPTLSTASGGAQRAGGHDLSTEAGAKGRALNPAWVEHLMGFPPGWTEIPPSMAEHASRSAGPRARRRHKSRGKPRARPKA